MVTRSPGATSEVGKMLAILAARAGATRTNIAATNTALRHELGMRLVRVAMQDFMSSEVVSARVSAFISALLQMDYWWAVVCIYVLLVKALCLRTRQLQCAAHGVGLLVRAYAAAVWAAPWTCAMHVAFCCACVLGFLGLGVMRRAVRTIIRTVN